MTLPAVAGALSNVRLRPPRASPVLETVAGGFLIIVALAAAQNAVRGELGDWLAAKFLNREPGVPPAASAVPLGGARPAPANPASPVASSPCGQYQNGRIPAEALMKIGQGGHKLAPAAAAAFIRMREAARADGVELRVTDSYRSLRGQIRCRQRKGNLCATPGTSKHGCGEAIDVTRSGRKWVQRNGERFGWRWPSWARPGGSKHEPWHFEFVG